MEKVEVMRKKSGEILKGFDGWGYGGILITLIFALIGAIESSKNPKGTYKFVLNFLDKSAKGGK
jgi:hypothetical protein